MTENLPPQDIEAEQAVLSAILLKPEVLVEVVPLVGIEDFSSTGHRAIYSAILELDENNTTIDVLTVKGWLEDHQKLQRVGGPAYLAEILNSVPSISNVFEYAKRVRDKSRLRSIIGESRRIIAEAHGTVDDVQAFIDASEHAIFEISETKTSTIPRILKDCISESFKDLQSRIKSDRQRRAISGLVGLDEILVGTDPGDVTIVAARPGMGKTALGVNCFALNTARSGKAVLIFSLEMGRQRLVQRVTCSEGRVNSRLMDQDRLNPDDWRRITAAAQSIQKLPIFIDDESGITMATIRAKARRVASICRKMGLELGLILIDYLQLVTTDPKYRSREEGVAAVSRHCKRLAKSLDVPLVVLAQLNREVEKRGKKPKPKLSDLRESGGIEQDADAIVFLYEDAEQQDANMPTIVVADVAKGRHRGTGSAKIAFTKAFTRFDDLEEGYEPERGRY
jgi:replicative DNA helicase